MNGKKWGLLTPLESDMEMNLLLVKSICILSENINEETLSYFASLSKLSFVTKELAILKQWTVHHQSETELVGLIDLTEEIVESEARRLLPDLF